jgi:hypothetical protein
VFALVLLALVVVVFVAPLLPQTGTVGQFLIGEITKGARVGAAFTWNDTAETEVAENPDDLAASANLDLQTYTLACIISSEEGNAPVLYWVAVAWVAVNNSLGGDVFSYATDGSFGRQGAGRPVATSVPPYEGHVSTAKAVLARTIGDPTGGAKYFVAPRAQDALHAREPDTYKSFAEVNASRLASGLKLVTPDGIDSKLLVFYA